MAFVMLSVGVHAGILLAPHSSPSIQSVRSSTMQVQLEQGKTSDPEAHTDSADRPEVTAKPITPSPEPEPVPEPRISHTGKIPPPPETQPETTPVEQPAEPATQQSAESSDAPKPARFDPQSADHAIDQTLLQSQVKARLQESLKLHLEYPEMARRRGWEGEVTISVQLDREGKIMDVAIRESSGYRILDDNTLNTLKNLPRLEGVGTMLDGKGITLQLPVIYQLSRI
ncbi:energy transducer TonB [Thiohalophilus sp.]|uniref:energy transducer TonB n=1 Tax=Thiohalophilus sp. TaxID=3028392 RepID=UPI003976280C